MMLFLNTKKQTEERATVYDFSPVHVYIENQLESSLVEGKNVVWTAPTVFLCSCQGYCLHKNVKFCHNLLTLGLFQ